MPRRIRLLKGAVAIGSRNYERWPATYWLKLCLLVAGGFLIALVLPALSFSSFTANAQNVCDKYAAQDGSDTADGTGSAPFRTAQKLVDSLTAGQTGCLRSGTYTEPDNDNTLTISKGGAPGQRVVLRSAPGEDATFLGRLYIREGADWVTVRDLLLDGSGGPTGDGSDPALGYGTLSSPTVNGDYAQFIGNEVTNQHKGICFDLGHYNWGKAVGTTIQNNRIHDCGRLPRSNHDHGIYVDVARDTRIIGNQIYDNADRGIQLYPDAQGSLIQYNVIDGNGTGIIFSGDDGNASSNNTVTNNLITNSTARYNSEHYWPSGNPVGQGNVLEDNCVYGGVKGDNGNGGILWPTEGYTATNNTYEDPIYINRGAKDFGLDNSSPCKSVVGDTPVAQSTTATLAASPTLADFDGTTTLTGTLSDAASKPLSNEKVTVWKSTDNGGTWTQDGQTTTDASGNYTYTTSPLTQDISYRIHFIGDASHAEATSRDVDVQVRPGMSKPQLSGTYVTPYSGSTYYVVKRSTQFTISGQIKPYRSGSTTIELYYYWGGSWYYYTSLNAPNRDIGGGTASYSASYQLPGPLYWKARAKYSDSGGTTSSPDTIFYVS